MSEWVFTRTNYRATWEKKALDTTIQLPKPITDNVIAGYVLNYFDGLFLSCEDMSFLKSYCPGYGAKTDNPLRYSKPSSPGDHIGENYQRIQPKRLQQHRHQPGPLGRLGEGRIVVDVANCSG